MISFILMFTAFLLFPTMPGFTLPLIFLAWTWEYFRSYGKDDLS